MSMESIIIMVLIGIIIGMVIGASLSRPVINS
jgi:FtsH-binding integral membrane protein